MPNPRLNPAILISPVENGYIAYDPLSDRLHQLNPIAALLTELSDGSRSVDEIRELVGPLMPEGKATAVDDWVADATKAGLIAVGEETPASHRELSAEELYKLAKRLDEKDKPQTAYLCVKRAVELNPDNPKWWYTVGEIAQCVGRRDEARVAYEKYLEANPNNAEIRHLVTALRDEPAPPRAPNDTIQHIYKNFASSYDSQMREELKYQGPERLAEGIESVFGNRQDLSVLDLGCGSGLSGMVFKRWARRMIGLDLSPEMIAVAQKRGVYDELNVAEITEFLARTGEKFDLITSCDVIIYFGDLKQVVAAAGGRLSPDGAFAFTMERGNVYPFKLTDTGRYAHHPDHVREAAKAAGLNVAYLNEAFLRNEYGVPVTGIFAVVKK